MSENIAIYEKYAAILFQVFHIGLLEASFDLSILTDQNIAITDPYMNFVPSKDMPKYLSIPHEHFLSSCLTYRVEHENHHEYGFMLFIFNEYADATPFNLDDPNQPYPQKIATDKLTNMMEKTNILGNCILKTLGNKTSIKIHVQAPESYIIDKTNLVENMTNLSDLYQVEIQDLLVIESNFYDENAQDENKLSLFIFPGNTFNLFVNKLINDRANW